MRPTPTRIVLALAALLASPLVAGETNETAATKPVAPAGAAMRVQIDPSTGQHVSPVSRGAGQAALAAAPAESAAPLRVEQGKTKAGGKMIRLDGRYRMVMTASVGADGKVSRSCTDQLETSEAGSAVTERH